MQKHWRDQAPPLACPDQPIVLHTANFTFSSCSGAMCRWCKILDDFRCALMRGIRGCLPGLPGLPGLYTRLWNAAAVTVLHPVPFQMVHVNAQTWKMRLRQRRLSLASEERLPLLLTTAICLWR